VKSSVATFFDVFPNGTIWANELEGGGYDVFLLGTVEPMHIDVDQMEQRLARPDYSRVAESLRQVGFNSAVGLLSTYAGQAQDLRNWLVGAAINRDRNLRLQYLAGLALNYSEETAIYSQMLASRRFPQNLFAGSPAHLEELQAAFAGANR
jgi:spermidine synthase